MSSPLIKAGMPARPLAAPPATTNSANEAPDVGLSAAFRQALGAKSGEAHLRSPNPSSLNVLARVAKADRPKAPLKGSPGKTHIGPRSGHK